MNKTYWKIIFTTESLIIAVLVLCILNKAGVTMNNGLIDIACAGTTNSKNPCEDSDNALEDKNIEIIDNGENDKVVAENKNDIKMAIFHEDAEKVEENNNQGNYDNLKIVEEKYKDQIKKTYKTNITSYNSEAGQTDDSPCITASGLDVCKRNTEDIVATNDLPLHTKILIPEYFGERIFYVEDRMNVRYTGTGRVDIWMKNKTDSKQWGIKYTKIIVLKD